RNGRSDPRGRAARTGRRRHGSTRCPRGRKRSAAVLTKPFTTGPFLGGQVLVVGAERTRVGDHRGVTVRGVVQPQTGGLVESVASSEERSPGPVRGDLEGAWNTQGEALGSGLLARKAHRAIVSHAARAASSLPDHALGKQGEKHR